MYLKNKNVTNKNRPTRSRKKYLILALAILLVAAAAFGGYWKFGHKNASRTTPTTANSSTKGEPANSSDTESNSGSTGQTSDSSSTGTSDKNTNSSTGTNVSLTDPTGNFVSNHHPNLGGSPAPNTMQSSCSTTPGATCQISFTNGSTTKTLAAKKTDSGGGAYWSYKLQDIGLTEGSWSVKATATLGSQTKTASDAMPLEVQP